VLTTPVIRCIKKQTNAEIHFLVKQKFSEVLSSHPLISKIWTIEHSTSEVIKQLKTEHFDLVLDLHNNFRSIILSWQLARKTIRFNKLNIEKWLMTRFKIDKLPPKHLVDRYFDALESIEVFNDDQGLDFFIHSKDHTLPSDLNCPETFIAGVLGATHKTKQIPLNKWQEIIEVLDLPVVMLGGQAEKNAGDQLADKFPSRVYNFAGKLSIGQSAFLIRKSECVITPDTGMMHIAAAYHKPMHVVWGNTIPKFGMFPYVGTQKSHIKYHELKHLKCRPCSKLGFTKCPKKHFKCMQEQVFDHQTMKL
jgi:ADP-heptose:LPS heptosyltransferase